MLLTQNDIKSLYAARKLMLDDISLHYTIEEIARHSGLSPTKLKKGFKMIFGAGLFEYLETARFEKAKEMMADRNKSLKQISKEAGFKHQNNFSKAFKKRYGMTPGTWRNRLNTILVFTGLTFNFL
jgi:AraC-like DNA-binding protein